MMAALAKGASTRSVLSIRLLPRTRARAFGLPKRTEKPAASSTTRGAGSTTRGADSTTRGADSPMRGADSLMGFVDIMAVWCVLTNKHEG